ncbi:MAG TPA: class I SAM-dependent methyltransferase [Actinomycetota bacterium]|jgi:ubiquinone/menaquinone biosynthesis C-methylase UbiE|nr:class I SAM-dependent methyltransferase [Actinomycetota bacterium]
MQSGAREPIIGGAAVYDRLSRIGLGSFFDHVAADIASTVPKSARVLEAGCGPGHLSIRLADRHRFQVIAVDVDAAMVRRARANARRVRGRVPSFLVGDVASLAFPDRSFDLVVSTFSMHHWADPAASLVEIGRVLRPGATAIIWDLRPGVIPFHSSVPDPVEHSRGSALRVARVTGRPWPWRFLLTQRIELIREDGPAGGS